LVTPEDHLRADQAVLTACSLIRGSVDLKRLQSIAEAAALNAVANPGNMGSSPDQVVDARGMKIGYFDSPAFTFYYPENMEAIDRTGAVRVSVDPMKDRELPPVDALYIGGGFPEVHSAQLAANAAFRGSVAASVRNGLPVWAECGGLMFLSRSIQWRESSYPMAGCIPADIVLGDKPEGHGYEEAVADTENPFIPPRTTIRGHEFHYSRIIDSGPLKTVFDVRRGVGLGNGRDGIIQNRVLASYLHVHSVASPGWANWLAQAAMQYRQEKQLRATNGRSQ
jgi:cobyrinic acid a,c-diamide synthase